MCRRSKVRCGGLIYLTFFFTLVLGLAAGQARGQYRAAYWDGDYRTSWADEAVTIAVRDDFEDTGYEILDAYQLKTFMDARIADGATSVVVFCRDNAPDTVIESISANCTLRRYLDAGGKIVWYSDIPLWDIAHSDGTSTYCGGDGCANILGIAGIDWTNSTGSQVTLTDDGIDWGLTETWGSERWTPANQVDIILASDSAGNAAAWVKHFVPGDTTGGFIRIWDIDVTPDNRPSFEELLAVAEYGLGSNPCASDPSPADGALLTEFASGLLGYSFSWKPGGYAVSHDVYFGTDYAEVEAGTGDTFRGNQTVVYFHAGYGYTPNDPVPTGFVPGTTYYWRIDEVHDTEPNSPWKGDIWSFEVADIKAYAPAPVEGSKFINPNVDLSWQSGLGMSMQTAYFGDDYDTVNSATTGGIEVTGTTTYDPGPLEYDTVYYWRVDTFGVYGLITGDVWSFTTARAGGGVRGDYYRGMNFDNFVLSRTESQIDFNWGDPGGPDPAVGDDIFSARWTGEVEAAFTETYTFYARADDGVRLWVDGRQLVDAWIDQSVTEYRGTIDLVAGNVYSLVMEYYENTVDAVAELRWSSPSTPKDFVPQAALAPPVKARNPNPPNRATGVKMTPILTWSPGDYAVSHQVYFGTDADAVRDATTDSPEYIGTMELGSESYDPGKLAWTSTYYWRVDEVNNLNPDGPWVGRLWSFTTGDFLVIDDFEDYDADENRIFYAWHEGLGYGYPGDPPFPGNGTGSEVGDDSTSSYTEETIVHSGGKSMPYWYNNNKQGCACYSEAELTLTAPRDWTEEGVAELSLWFRGLSTNDAEPLYVAVANKTGTPVVVTHDDPAASQINTWTQWVIPLQTIADQGITLTDVDRIIIGVGTRDNLTTPGGAGKMYFDDIRLELPSAVDGE